MLGRLEPGNCQHPAAVLWMLQRHAAVPPVVVHWQACHAGDLQGQQLLFSLQMPDSRQLRRSSGTQTHLHPSSAAVMLPHVHLLASCCQAPFVSRPLRRAVSLLNPRQAFGQPAKPSWLLLWSNTAHRIPARMHRFPKPSSTIICVCRCPRTGCRALEFGSGTLLGFEPSAFACFEGAERATTLHSHSDDVPRLPLPTPVSATPPHPPSPTAPVPTQRARETCQYRTANSTLAYYLHACSFGLWRCLFCQSRRGLAVQTNKYMYAITRVPETNPYSLDLTCCNRYVTRHNWRMVGLSQPSTKCSAATTIKHAEDGTTHSHSH